MALVSLCSQSLTFRRDHIGQEAARVAAAGEPGIQILGEGDGPIQAGGADAAAVAIGKGGDEQGGAGGAGGGHDRFPFG